MSFVGIFKSDTILRVYIEDLVKGINSFLVFLYAEELNAIIAIAGNLIESFFFFLLNCWCFRRLLLPQRMLSPLL